MCEYFYSSGCFSATLIPDLSWYSTSVNSVILNQASKLLHLSEVILQCSTLTKDQYPVRVPAASSLESSATPTHCTALPMLLLTVSWLPATSHELQKRDCIVSCVCYKPGTETLDRNFSRKMPFVIKQVFQSKWQNQQNPSKNQWTIPTLSSSSLQQMTEHNS